MKKGLRLFAVALVALCVMGSIFANGATEAKNEVPTIKWVQIGNGTPSNYDSWKAKVDEYLMEKLGCKLEVETIKWGDWDTRRNVIINTNEPWDIMFTDQKSFARDVALGAYADLTDLLSTTPGLTSLIPADYFKAVTVDGAVYGVPTYKDSSLTNYWVWAKPIVDKYNIPYQDLHTLDDILPYAKQVKEGEGSYVRILAADAPTFNIAPEFAYDEMGLGIPTIGVRIDDETRTVVSVAEQEEVMEYLRDLHEWYELGLVNSDAGTLAEAPKYMPLKIAQGWPYAAVTTWGPQMGCEAVVSQAGESILTNGTVMGSISCISSSSPNQELALKVLELANTDPYFRDMLYYGEPGVNWEYTEDGRVHRITPTWDMPGYCQATFFAVTMTDDTTYNQWDEVKELNANATASVMLGFTPDRTSIENELINLNNIWMKYKQQINSGASDPDTAVPMMMKEMRNAGFDKVVAELQRQIDEAF